MKFLILGCNGMAGHMISQYLMSRHHSVLGFAREESQYVPSICGDAMDTNTVANIVRDGKFDSIVNCIGVLNQNAEDNKARAAFLNAYFPNYLAELTEMSDTKIIQISTDCVFSGVRGAYKEDDFRDGETFYAKSKALGELDDGKNITLRTSIIGPDINVNGIGLLNWFMKQTVNSNTQSCRLRGFTQVRWTGITTLQLARVVEKASAEKVYGLYNIVPANTITKYELLKLFNEYFRSGAVNIEPVADIVSDKSLIRSKPGFDCSIPSYEDMISELSQWMNAHRTMYKHCW